ncbi:hypothetical protein [Brucella intermedia]|uniref:hypothetical protein n=1 Tax=Brucella intermedia TaxID=94625 RepID=UPI00236259FA|nr:hypothetical protein [Brucella intermedia]
MSDLPMIIQWRGTDIRELSKDELLTVVIDLFAELEQARQFHRLEVAGWKMLLEVKGSA